MHSISAGCHLPAVLPVLRVMSLSTQQALQNLLQELRTQPRQQELLCVWHIALWSGWLAPSAHMVLCSWMDPDNALQWAGGQDQQLQPQPPPAPAPKAAPLLALALLSLFALVEDAADCVNQELLHPLAATDRLCVPWADHLEPEPAQAGGGFSAAPGAARQWDLSALTPQVVGCLAQLLQVQVAGMLAGTQPLGPWALLSAFEYLFRRVHGAEPGLVARREMLLQVIHATCSAHFVAACSHVQGSTDAVTGAMGPGKLAAADAACGATDITPQQCQQVWLDLLQAAPPTAAPEQDPQNSQEFLQAAQPAATTEQSHQDADSDAAAANAAETPGMQQQEQRQANNNNHSSSSPGPLPAQLGPQHLPRIIAEAEAAYGSEPYLCLKVSIQVLNAAMQREPCNASFASLDWPPSGPHLAMALANVVAAGLSHHPHLSALHPVQQYCLELVSFTEAVYCLHPAALSSSQLWADLCVDWDGLQHSCHVLRTLHACVTWCTAWLEQHRAMSHPVCPGACTCQALAGALAGDLLLLWHQEAHLLALVDMPEAQRAKQQQDAEPPAAVQIRTAAAADLPDVLKGMLQELLASACGAQLSEQQPMPQQQQEQQQQLSALASPGQVTEDVVSCGRKLLATWQAVYSLLLLPGAELVQAHAAVCLGGSCLAAFLQLSVGPFEAAVRSGQYAAAEAELDRLLGHLQRRPSPQAVDVDFSVPPTQA
jgi:hypothetical protein